MSAGLENRPVVRLRFESSREAARHILSSARTAEGHFLPVNAAELAARLESENFFVSASDAEALLRELAADGEAVEIDALAGYRWIAVA